MMADSQEVFFARHSDGKARLIQLALHFREKFAHNPSFFVRAPGRVNLIGEHIDYCGYAVLPMAIEQDILVAVGGNNQHKINLTSLDGYSDFTTATDHVKIDSSNPQWYYYFLCGFRGIAEHQVLTEAVPVFTGFDAAVSGTIPSAAGLSSSSALVCAAALATAHLFEVSLPKLELADICARSEHYIGTQGGGMDQAVILLAEGGTAQLIEFDPLKVTSVSLPKGVTFVIADTGVRMNKASTVHFNIRVVECRLAAHILAKVHGLEWRKYPRLCSVQRALHVHLNEMHDVVKKVLHKHSYTRKEVCQILEITSQELDMILTENTRDIQEFKLFQRCLHVYEEANRVWMFKEACERQSSDAIETLGQLMNESHKSCQTFYECSHPALDELVKVSLESGALGSRLTGAGWGGCTVSLVHSKCINSYLDQVREKYYAVNPSRQKLAEYSIFPTFPGNGASVYRNTLTDL